MGASFIKVNIQNILNLVFKIDQLCRQIVRKIARTLVRFPAKWYFNRQFEKAFTDDYDTFWVVDIDNTIADSWRKMTPQYDRVFRSQSDKMMNFEAFESMQRLFQDIPPRTRVIFLSARQYIRYAVTKKWLKKHGFEQADSVLVLVERMADKAPLLAAVVKNYFDKKSPPQYLSDFEQLLPLQLNAPTFLAHQNTKLYPIVYFDDLSYNHEYGEVLFYENVIEAVQKMPVKYLGYAELLILQSKS